METSSYPSKRKNQGSTSIQGVHYTPNNKKKILETAEEFTLYQLHKESSPNFRAGQDVLEVGWGDSPEPLNMDDRVDFNNINKTTIKCKKKLDTKESPKSSEPLRRRMVRSTFTLPPDSIVDVAKYVAEVQELSKNIIKELDSKGVSESQSEGEKLFTSSRSIEDDFSYCRIVPDRNSVKYSEMDFENNDRDSKFKDSAFDSIIQTFIEEEDDWLSQAMPSQDLSKLPHKTNFVKSKSENELVSSQAAKTNLTQAKNLNSFKRASSFDLTKTQNNLNKAINHSNKDTELANVVNRYSLQEIEKKRLEAKYRRERKEIERKKLEAIKKLEMKKLKAIKT